MNTALKAILSAAIGAGLAGGGYWYGARHPAVSMAGPQAAASPSTAPAGRKILYYRNPMGLADTSPVPKKDSMGMDYIPVVEGEEARPGEIRIAPERIQRLGVRTEAATERALVRTVRAVGTIQADERALRAVAPRIDGWIDRLHVNATGQPVRRGEPLMEVYSPELASAQQEYLVAVRGVAALKDAGPELQANMRSLMEASLHRLRNLGIADDEISRLRATGNATNTLTLRSPADGIVLEKKAVQGMRFMAGEMLYRIADLGSVWVYADVFEQDLGAIRIGQGAIVTVPAYPGEAFQGKVSFLYPTVNPDTRTARVRIDLPNRGLRLKPDMYANVELAAGGAERRLTVPDSAVLDTGTRKLVLVQRGEGLFEPREVRTGRSGDGLVEVLEGVRAGEQVVVSANFLIDAESNLKSALGSVPGSASTAPGKSTHSAEGTIESVDPASGTATIAHGPVPSLKWPAMTMDFALKDPGARKLKVGDRIRFEFTETSPGEWAVVRSSPAGGANVHQGH